MDYRHLGKAGLRLSELSFGAWLTFDREEDLERMRSCVMAAFDAGVNFFDNAEVYGRGTGERLMGIILESFRREDLVISTKIFWGGEGPNDEGLSWKHLMEGTRNSLRRLKLDYVDLLYCHRPDPNTPIEETVRAMDVIIRSGMAFYWGTSMWPRESIEEAHRIARELGCIPPAVEQPEYNLFNRQRVEQEYLPLYERYGMGLTTWSPLDSGILTGKYQQGIPPGTRLERQEWLRKRLTEEKRLKVSRLQELAGDLSCSLPQLAIAWCLKNPHVSSVITGATTPDQVRENMGAATVKQKLDRSVMDRIEEILGGC